MSAVKTAFGLPDRDLSGTLQMFTGCAMFSKMTLFLLLFVPQQLKNSALNIKCQISYFWYWYVGGIHKYINKTISFLTQAYSVASVFIFLVKIVLVKAKQCKRVIWAYFFVEDAAQTDEGAAPPDVPVSGDQDQVCVSTFFCMRKVISHIFEAIFEDAVSVFTVELKSNPCLCLQGLL